MIEGIYPDIRERLGTKGSHMDGMQLSSNLKKKNKNNSMDTKALVNVPGRQYSTGDTPGWEGVWPSSSAGRRFLKAWDLQVPPASIPHASSPG